MKEIISTLEQSGYDGWYSVEFYGSLHMLEDTAKSMEFLRQQDQSLPCLGISHKGFILAGDLYAEASALF